MKKSNPTTKAIKPKLKNSALTMPQPMIKTFYYWMKKAVTSLLKRSIKKLTAQVKELGEKEFDFTPIPEVLNPQGLEHFTFLEEWTSGIEFIKEIEEEL
jgi:hypothetical protein